MEAFFKIYLKLEEAEQEEVRRFAEHWQISPPKKHPAKSEENLEIKVTVGR